MPHANGAAASRRGVDDHKGMSEVIHSCSEYSQERLCHLSITTKFHNSRIGCKPEVSRTSPVAVAAGCIVLAASNWHKRRNTLWRPYSSPEPAQGSAWRLRSPLAGPAQILEIIESGTWQLRHLVGPGALPFLDWRKSMTDEEWVGLHAAGDDAWYSRMERDFGMAIRPRN